MNADQAATSNRSDFSLQSGQNQMYGSHSFPSSCGPCPQEITGHCQHSYLSTEHKVAQGVFLLLVAAMEAGYLPASMNKFLPKNIVEHETI